MSNYIIGRRCLLEVLRSKPKTIVKIYILESKADEQKETGSFYAIMELIEQGNFDIEYVSKKRLSDLVFSDSHQGFVAELKPRSYLDLKSFFQNLEAQKREKFLVVMLDTIMDPHNFGAILRACECFDVTAVVFSKNRGASLTPAVCKVSSGASELVDIIQVSNLAQTVEKFKEEGFEVIAADLSEDAKELFKYQFSSKTLLIMGSEEKGVQPLIKKSADAIVTIPMKGQIDSLNVSQAAAIFLAVIANQIRS